MSTPAAPFRGTGIPLRRIALFAVLGWTLVAIGVYTWEVTDSRDFVTANAKAIARASYEKDIAFRRWAAGHGGVYVPVTPKTPINPYLNVPERDVATPAGKLLTLMNPAYMIRQIYESMRSIPDAPQGHITSLAPIRPENVPDDWERKALRALGSGGEEFSEYQHIDGTRYFRFMHVLKAEKPCLTCHAAQGYREGDVRGGISVTIAVDALERAMAMSNMTHFMIIAMVWGVGMVGIWLAVRHIGRSARALSESEERYRQQFRQSRAVMLIINPEDGVIVDANPAACVFYGYTYEELLALKMSDVTVLSSAARAGGISPLKNDGTGQSFARHRHADGTVMDVEVFGSPILFQDKTLQHLIVVDISDRLAAEQELRDKMDFAENLVLNSTAPTFVINFDHQVLIWNRALEELTGIAAAEVIGTDGQWRAFYSSARPCLADIVLDGKHEETLSLYPQSSHSRLIPGGLNAEGDYSFADRRCRLVFAAAPVRDRDGRIIAAIETLEDITERISLEAQLFHSQKMESVGELAGGIAHDFNNILTVISGYANLLQLTLPSSEEALAFVREISTSVDRAAYMTRSLLAFSGKQEMLLQYDDLNEILADISKSLGRLIREDITLIVRPGEERLPVYADRVQVEQVLINLVVNARDAMKAGGVITISTMLTHLREKRIMGNVLIPPGRYVCLCVGDNGTGIDAKNMERIFEPFFTTKDKGRGTGLGLSIVHSIVTKHNGSIFVTSTPGFGAEFHVYLPLYVGDMIEMGASAVTLPASHRGGEIVLVVEDDEAIMKLLQEVLSRYGYGILSAVDGVEAMEVFAAHRDEIGIAVIDVIMPRMNGREVVERIRMQRPDLPVIMTSGYTDEIIDLAVISELRVAFLQKPVRPQDLLATIESCLHTNE